MDFDVQLGSDLATAEHAQAVLDAANDTGSHQRFSGDRGGDVDKLVVDGVLETVEIDLGEIQTEDVVEAALRQTTMQRHLAAFEALDAHARTRGLALAATAGRLALAGANAAADAHALFAGAGVIGDIAELHRSLPFIGPPS